jgi:hypothetical protein
VRGGRVAGGSGAPGGRTSYALPAILPTVVDAGKTRLKGRAYVDTEAYAVG